MIRNILEARQLEKLNQAIEVISHNYILIIIGAVIFFGLKALFGYLTYKKIMRQFEEIKELIKERK
ncbi:hypothetical protein ASD40_17805 [Paenibacillus sp. Root444D2]|nr:hypothetical protein ASD40_17805 [Paenibacillus sp. Root444D2]KRE48499.1 hypothetical protein ASG85_04045 [Paenibacillus sp. Soil724D2]